MMPSGKCLSAEATASPPAARIYGIAAVALYDAVVPGTVHHRSLIGQLNALAAVLQPKKYGKHHWPIVANAALGPGVEGKVTPCVDATGVSGTMQTKH
jgi:hypothetical protein